MTVTQISDIDKKRSRVYIDGEFAFVLYKGELREYNIREDLEISEAVYHEITEVLLPKRCKLRAMNLLQKKDYTVRQLTDKLREGLYPQEVIDEAVEYVRSYRYLDDERYARDYITYHMENRSRTRIIQDLTTRGIDRDMLMPLMEELYQDDDGSAELEQIKRLLVKRHYDPDNTDFKEEQKIMGFLLRKGFSMSDIKKTMESLK
jgi:regulatory protein